MEQPSSPEPVVMHEVDLGQHTLFLMSDGTMDLLANDAQTPYLAENALHLESEETYRLFLCLHDQFQQVTIPETKGN